MEREAIIRQASQMKNQKDLLILLNRIKMDGKHSVNPVFAA